jgi:hypothetical protein
MQVQADSEERTWLKIETWIDASYDRYNRLPKNVRERTKYTSTSIIKRELIETLKKINQGPVNHCRNILRARLDTAGKFLGMSVDITISTWIQSQYSGAYRTKPGAKATSGVISLPWLSLALSISTVETIIATAIQMLWSAKYRPGQRLQHTLNGLDLRFIVYYLPSAKPKNYIARIKEIWIVQVTFRTEEVWLCIIL